MNNNIAFADIYHVGPHKAAATYIYKQILSQFEFCADIGRKYLVDTGKPYKIVGRAGLLGPPEEPTLDRILEVKKINPKAFLLVVVRERESWSRSLYKFSVKRGGTRNFDEYVASPKVQERLDIHQLIDGMEKIMPGRVITLKFEDVTRKPQEVIDLIGKLLGVEAPQLERRPSAVRVSSDDFTTEIRRVFNRYPSLWGMRNVLLFAYNKWKKAIKIMHIYTEQTHR